MANWNDVRRVALALPEAAEPSSGDGLAQWRVRGKLFAWERPLRRADIEALGGRAPSGAILAVRVPHLVAKEALLATNPAVYFTMPHFDGYPAVLVRLGRIGLAELEELLVEAWVARAPKRLATKYRNRLGLPGRSRPRRIGGRHPAKRRTNKGPKISPNVSISAPPRSTFR